MLCAQILSCVWLFVVPWTVAHQASLPIKFPKQEYQKKWKWPSHVWLFATPGTIQSMEFSRPENWSGKPLSSSGYLPTQGSNPGLLHCRQLSYLLNYWYQERILEWGAISYSRRSSELMGWIYVCCVSCIGRHILYLLLHHLGIITIIMLKLVGWQCIYQLWNCIYKRLEWSAHIFTGK